MSFRNVLPHIIQPFRLKHSEQPEQPMCLGPLDVLQVMEFVEQSSRLRTRSFAPGALVEDGPVLVPERGFRY